MDVNIERRVYGDGKQSKSLVWELVHEYDKKRLESAVLINEAKMM